jgi:hypothetical protein
MFRLGTGDQASAEVIRAGRGAGQPASRPVNGQPARGRPAPHPAPAGQEPSANDTPASEAYPVALPPDTYMEPFGWISSVPLVPSSV